MNLAWHQHADRQRWRNGDEWDETATKIAVGVIGERWYARMYAGGVHCDSEQIGRVYAGQHAEHYARGTARRWMRTVGGRWVDAAIRAPGSPARA